MSWRSQDGRGMLKSTCFLFNSHPIQVGIVSLFNTYGVLVTRNPQLPSPGSAASTEASAAEASAEASATTEASTTAEAASETAGTSSAHIA